MPPPPCPAGLDLAIAKRGTAALPTAKETGTCGSWSCNSESLRCRVHKFLPSPSAVSSDPGERRVVGRGLHRVDQRHAGERPRFRGHRQPHVPARPVASTTCSVRSTQAWQADLATATARHGFCYYHYWFERSPASCTGRSTRSSARGAPDFPFCLALGQRGPWTRDVGRRRQERPDAAGLRRQSGVGTALQVSGERVSRPALHPCRRLPDAADLPSSRSPPRCWTAGATWPCAAAWPHVVSMRTYYGSDARELFDAQLEFEPFCTLSRLPFRHRAFEKVANTASRLCWRVFGRAPLRRAVSTTG